MVERVAILGYGLVPYRGVHEVGTWSDEAVFDAITQALGNVGLQPQDIDSVEVPSVDAFDGLNISNGLLAPAAGGYGKDTSRAETSGMHSTGSALRRILSGSADVVAVVSADTVEFDPDYVTNIIQDPIFRGPLGFNAAQSYGLLCMDYMRRSGATEYDFAEVASKNYQCGALNDQAHIRRAYTTEEIQASEVACWPLRKLELGPMSHGAVALLLASETKASAIIDNPVWITGYGTATTAYNGSWKELSGPAGLQAAAQKACTMAGVKQVRGEINFVEIANQFAPFELMAYEALGLCGTGKGPALLEEGVTYPDGDLPVNLSGGSLCTNGANSGGVFRIAQAMRQLRNGGGNTNQRAFRKALVHDSDQILGAVGGVSHGVMILEQEN